jgi:D-alanyl-D-alanine carboxypeptidase
MNQKRNSPKRQRHFPLVFMLFIIVITTSIFIGSVFKTETEHEIPPRLPVLTNSVNSNLTEAPTILAYDHLVELSNNHLLLINNDYEIPSDLPGEYVAVSDYVRTLNINLLLNNDALIMLKELFDFAAGIGYNEFRVTESYRTLEYQQTLYNTVADKSLVALPGHSEHQTGLAVDISYNGVNIGNSRQGTWLMDNAYKFGFILRYPGHKTDITKIPYEPWHYRYIGQPHAYYCYQNDFVLEEYIKHLQENRGITTTFNGTEYKIYYLSHGNDEIEISQNSSYSISTDNTGGLIVTVWLD